MIRAFAVTTITLLLLQPSSAAAQDTMTQARTLYASADYEQALMLLENVSGNRESHYFRALCLIALGRPEAAAEQIEAVLKLDPMFLPPAGEVSPRVSATFVETRRRLLPEIARATFAEARARFQAGEREIARKQLELTMRMLDESGSADGEDLSDLRLVVSGFLDLSKEVEPAPVPVQEPARSEEPVAQPAAAPPPAAAAQGPRPIQPASVATVPITIVQDLPPWRPDSTAGRRTFSGSVRVEIDEKGRVTSATMRQPVYPSYDPLVLEAAKKWLYQPATLNGVPVPSEKTVEIQLRP